MWEMGRITNRIRGIREIRFGSMIYIRAAQGKQIDRYGFLWFSWNQHPTQCPASTQGDLITGDNDNDCDS